MSEKNKYKNHNINNWSLYVCRNIAKLKHKNIEKILHWFYSEGLFHFFPEEHTDTIESIIRDKTQFVEHDIKKLFVDFHEALVFLKQKNICHKNINPKNLRFNEKKGFIGGFLEIQHPGTMYTSFYGNFLKSRRYLLEEYTQESHRFLDFVYVQQLPSDDMWNLVHIYVYIYYGFDPFNPKMLLYPSLEVDWNTRTGNCMDITVDKYVSVYGKELMSVLTRNYEAYDYENILNVFKHNDDDRVNDEKLHKCVVCWSEKIKVKFEPCDHFVCCQFCARKINNTCPVCRAKIDLLVLTPLSPLVPPTSSVTQ